MLLRMYVRDRPVLRVSPIHPDVYQWWFRLSPSQHEGLTTRRYGFIAYIGIVNRGLRRVSIARWRLKIKTASGRSVELNPINLPEPTYNDAGFTKIYPVLGQRGLNFDGGTVVESGASIAGMVFFIYECYGHPSWDPSVAQGTVNGRFVVRDAFGGRARTRISFRKKDLDYVQSFSPDVDKIAR